MRFSDLKKIFTNAYAGYFTLANGVKFYLLTVAVTSGVTTTSAAAGSFAVTANATGRGLLFYSDGTYWVASDATSVPVKATAAEINTGTNDTKFVTPLAFADQTRVKSNTASYVRATTGAQTLLAASTAARNVIIVVKVITTFAAGDGAAPIFDIGETGSVEKFTADLTTGTAGDTLTYAGSLSANTALLITATAATGATSTGAIDVTAIAVQDA